MRMTKKELASICSLLIAGAAFGAVTDVVTASFEDGAAPSTGWTGAGTPIATNYEYAAASVGYPMSGDHTKVLPIDDAVTYAPASAQSGVVLLDMMVQASVPDDELEFPEGSENVQIAVGVSSNSMLQVWCTPKGGDGAAWCDLVQVADESWHRVTFVFDYTAGFAQVRVDGEPKMTSNGYLTPSTDEPATGAWYKLATDSSSSLASVQVVGSTGIDDFVIKSGTAGEAAAVAASTTVAGSTDGIQNSWFDKYGLGWNTSNTVINATSGMTVAQKYEAGLDPLSDDKLEIKAIAMSADKATFTLPPTDPAPGKAVKLYSATSSDFSTGKDDGTPVNGTTVELNLPGADAPVKYYRLETVNAE